MISNQLKAALQTAAASLLREAGADEIQMPEITIERPSKEEHGEFSTNVAMKLARICKRPPIIIAEAISERLCRDQSLHGLVKSVETASPGFVNFHLDWRGWALESDDGDMPANNNGIKALIEHTSINPNKSAHIGHLRNSCIGDTLARLLRYQGYEVEVHNYIDDLGNQLADTIVGLLYASTDASHVRFGDFCWDTYSNVNRAYKENPALLEHRTHVLEKLEKGNNHIAWLGFLAAERIVKEHIDEMSLFGIRYDVLVWESDIVREGFWEQTFQKLRNTTMFVKEREGKLAGCWVLKTSGGSNGSMAGGEDSTLEGGKCKPDETEAHGTKEHHEDKVLVRSNGVLTYTAKDIAYHLWKFGLLERDFRYRGFGPALWSTGAQGKKRPIGRADLVINVIDQRQQYPQAMVKEALHALGYEKQAEQLHHVGYGVVALSPKTASGLGLDTSDGKQAYAMSGRQGIGIKVDDLIARMEDVIDKKRSRRKGLSSRTIAAAAIRYYLLRFHLQTEIVFDLEQATEVTGNTGVYLLYAYARSCSVLSKGEPSGMNGLSAVAFDYAPFDSIGKPEKSLLRLLAYWPETVYAAERDRSPNVLCGYAFELASAFNYFYAVCPILKADPETRRFRLWLVQRCQAMLGNVLTLLGLPTPNEM